MAPISFKVFFIFILLHQACSPPNATNTSSTKTWKTIRLCASMRWWWIRFNHVGINSICPLSNFSIIIVLSLELVGHVGHKIGNPVNVDDSVAKAQAAAANTSEVKQPATSQFNVKVESASVTPYMPHSFIHWFLSHSVNTHSPPPSTTNMSSNTNPPTQKDNHQMLRWRKTLKNDRWCP